MPEDIRHQLDILIQLQEIETTVDKIVRALNQAPERIAELDERLIACNKKLEEEGNNLDHLKKEYRDYESETKDMLTQIEKSRTKLNSAKTNKEYQSSLKEIDDLEKKNSHFEDIMIQHLEKIDVLESRIVVMKEN